MVQIKGRDGSELIDPFTLTISKEGEIAKPDGVFLDDEIRLQLQIIKTDEKTGHRVTMSSASFKLRDYKGNPVYQEVVNKEGNPEKTDTFVTNNQGMVTLPAALATGKYTIEEIKAPDGYMLQENPMSIIISRSAVNGNTVELVKDKLLRVRFPNKAIEGKITVYKTGDIFKGLQLKEEHGETVTKAIFEKGYLSDVGFDIVAANDIVDPANGQVLYGSIKEMELKPGKYTFKEVLAPKGYAIKTSSLQFSVAADGVINTQEQEIRDELATYGLRKVDQQGKALQGAEFGLYCGEKLVDKAVSDEHGIVVFTQMDYVFFRIIGDSRRNPITKKFL